MNIGGLQKFSLIDYPGKISAVVFTQGCNFRCPYCHNPELVNPDFFEEPLCNEEVFGFLKSRKGKLDAVVVTGGEPTLQTDLIDFIERIKDMGYLVKLDSNGSNPETINKLIESRTIDYFAMDIKAPLEKYKEIARSSVDPGKIKQSIKLIMDSGLDYEFRTTVIKSMLDLNDIIQIAKIIKGAERYVLQKFVPTKTLDSDFVSKTTYSDKEFMYLKRVLKNYVLESIIR
ncbi:MAG: pyruvate formate lyase activating enzyme [Thermosediminibacterales bacterium]|nr:pyruvate formate lyase activating enzyme [Thermosediminibacterales bacterium]MDK2836926.1 pyruvate formate lyase activating enzyme [Thermosediminibacterales bacterium]